MKITDVKLTVIKLGALDKPYRNSIKQTTSKSWGRVELYTDDGIVGMAPTKSGSRSFIEGTIKKKLISEHPLCIDYLWQKMYNESEQSGKRWVRISP